MILLKKILFPIFSIFLCYRTIELMNHLIESDVKQINTLEALVISFLLTLFSTGIFAFLGFAFKTNKILPEAYYIVKNEALLRQIYKRMGVNHFRKLLLFAFWGRKKNKTKYFDGKRSGIENLIFQSKKSEFGHSAAFFLILLLAIILLFLGYWQLFVYMNSINILGNLYPVILQRMHRLRINQLLSDND